MWRNLIGLCRCMGMIQGRS